MAARSDGLLILIRMMTTACSTIQLYMEEYIYHQLKQIEITFAN